MARSTNQIVDRMEALYRTRLSDFVRVATAICGNRDTARDAVQDAFASAVRALPTYRGDGQLEAWVWRIVVNAARRARRRATTPDMPSEGHVLRAEATPHLTR